MVEIWKDLNDNSGAIGLIVVVIPLVWAAMRYLGQKRQELDAQRFETYHGLIKSLVEGESPDRPTMLDRQLATVFELRSFPRYYESTLRILKGLRDTWRLHYPSEDRRSRLIDEMDISISFIEKKYNRWHRALLRFIRSY